MTDIISIRLMGGLGNQLFQLFTVIAYSIEHNKTVVLPYVDKLHVGTVRNTYWETFLMGLKHLTTYNSNIHETNESLLKMQLYKESNFHYTQIPKLNARTLLFGYYQSYKYFEKYRNILLHMIQFKDHLNNTKHEYSHLFTDTDTDTDIISVHFRFADYKNIQESHPILDIQYYYNALCNICISNNKKYRILYFCQECDNDDVSQIISTLSNQFPELEFVKVDDSIQDWKQLLIMSLCNHNIIANSTYSWWAAWLNMNMNKIICYPNRWFGPALSHDIKDLFPSDWIKIYW